MYTKTKNLIQTLTSNIKKSTHIEEIEKVNAGLIKTQNRKFLGKPKNANYKSKPLTYKETKYYTKNVNFRA